MKRILIAASLTIVALLLFSYIHYGDYNSPDYDEDVFKQYVFTTYDYETDKNITLPSYYSDTLFDADSREKNPSLISFALCLELSSGIDAKVSERSASVLKLLNDIGCTKIKANDAYYKETSIDSTDAAIGYKEYNGYNVLFLVLNGTHYSNEKAANVMLGEKGAHTGFTYARDAGLELLRGFINENNISGDTKILVTGYSRTAAGANLLAAYISDAIAENKVGERIGNISLQQKDVYGFSFETPICGCCDDGQPLPSDPRYDNIWYVTNPDDLVTYVAPVDYGFIRYGHQVVLPSHDSAKAAQMLKNINTYFEGNDVNVYDLSKFKVISDVNSLEDFNKGFFSKFFESVGNRQYYHDNIENDCVYTTYVLGEHPELLKDVVDSSGGYLTLINGLYTHSNDPKDFSDYFRPMVSDAASKYGCSEYTDNIVGFSYSLIQIIKKYSDDSLWKLVSDKYVLSATSNVDLLFVPHYPAMTFCYVIIDDPNYKT